MIQLIRASDNKVIREIKTIPQLMEFFSEEYSSPDSFQQKNLVERAVALGSYCSHKSMNGQWIVKVTKPNSIINRIFGIG